MNNARNKGRFPVRVNLHSADFPNFRAEVLDISEGGAKVKLRRPPASNLADRKVKIGAFLSPKVNSLFKGVARVAWVRQTLDGAEAGLEWDSLTSSATSALKSALIKAGN